MNATTRRSTALLAALLRGDAIPWARVELSVDDFLAACDEQQITTLAYHRVRALDLGCGWPDAVCQRLAPRVRAAVARELLVREELIVVLDALAAAGVFPIILKGTALAYSMYDDAAMRPRVDTDLLIRSDEADRVRAVLAERGYSSPVHCDGELLFRQFPLRRTSPAGIEHWLDVHWKISTQSLFAEVLTRDEAELRARPLPRLGARARTLAPDEALLLACIHPVMHHRNAEPLIWLYDVHLLASSLSDADWLRLVRTAVARRVSAICAHQLARAQTTFGTSIDGGVLATLTAMDREPSAAYLRDKRRWTDELLANIRGLPRWRDRVRLVREIAFPGPAYMREAYGRGTSAAWSMTLPFLYVHRLVSGGWRALAGHK